MSKKVAVIGAGFWGKNLVRIFSELRALEWVCDTRADALAEASARYGVRTTLNYQEVLGDPGLDAVVLAVPAAQHYAMAREALLAGKDVYVEKPLALSSTDGQKLVELSTKRARILMVGHILEYHPA